MPFSDKLLVVVGVWSIYGSILLHFPPLLLHFIPFSSTFAPFYSTLLAIGMVDVFASDDTDAAPIGQWYSHPSAAACQADEKLGDVRPDGSRCTYSQELRAKHTNPHFALVVSLNCVCILEQVPGSSRRLRG